MKIWLLPAQIFSEWLCCEDREVAAALYVVDNDSLLLPGDCFEGSQPVICEMNAASQHTHYRLQTAIVHSN